jgi:hypothetical protein
MSRAWRSITRKRLEEQAQIAKVNDTDDPRTYDEAMERPDAAEWCEDEKRAFEKMGVFEVVPHPKGRKVVGRTWVFCV